MTYAFRLKKNKTTEKNLSREYDPEKAGGGKERFRPGAKVAEDECMVNEFENDLVKNSQNFQEM